jgi:DNA-binding MarR family transcriptional regulator
MTLALKEELKQTKPFTSLRQEAQLNIVRTHHVLSDGFERILKPHGITGTQYNVLRILRGAEPDGLCRNEVRERLLNRMPDATRLLDRMERAGLVVRSREGEDRRMVTTRITREGRKLVDDLDAVAESEHQRQLGHMSDQDLETLITLLTQARNPG